MKQTVNVLQLVTDIRVELEKDDCTIKAKNAASVSAEDFYFASICSQVMTNADADVDTAFCATWLYETEIEDLLTEIRKSNKENEKFILLVGAVFAKDGKLSKEYGGDVVIMRVHNSTTERVELNSRVVERSIRQIADILGADPNNEDLKYLPKDYLNNYTELCKSYYTDKVDVRMIEDDNIENDYAIKYVSGSTYSINSSTMLPYKIKYVFGYTPNPSVNKKIALSCIDNVVRHFSNRITTADSICQDVMDTLMEASLKVDRRYTPFAMGIVIKGELDGNSIVTSKLHGDIQNSERIRNEFMSEVSRQLNN